MKKIERYRRYKLRRLSIQTGQLEYVTVTAYKSPANGKHEITIHGAYENGALVDGSARIVRIPKESRFIGRDKFITEATHKVVQYFIDQGYALINPEFVVW